jgi:hypothetical protein
MGRTFWIKRFAAATALIFGALMLVELLKGHPPAAALTFSATWSVISGVVFTGARIYQSRRGRHCAICRDTPDAGPATNRKG